MENNFIVNENEKRVLKQIFNNSNISRTQISKNLELNKATISNILNNLKHKSLVNEVGEGNILKVVDESLFYSKLTKNMATIFLWI